MKRLVQKVLGLGQARVTVIFRDSNMPSISEIVPDKPEAIGAQVGIFVNRFAAIHRIEARGERETHLFNARGEYVTSLDNAILDKVRAEAINGR